MSVKNPSSSILTSLKKYTTIKITSSTEKKAETNGDKDQAAVGNEKKTESNETGSEIQHLGRKS